MIMPINKDESGEISMKKFSHKTGARGFTLVEIMIVVAIIGLLVAITFPNLIKARDKTRLVSCDNNLRLIGHSEEEYMMHNYTTVPVSIATLVTDEYLKIAPECPGGGSYTLDVGNGTIACDATDHGTYTIEEGVISH